MTWRFAAAKVQGVSHVRHELPCQDAFACAVVPSGEGDAFIAVVSDGAGSASQGGAGATFLCGELIARLTDAVVSARAPVADQWLAEHVGQVRESLLVEADQKGIEPRQMAATLLCSIVAPKWSAFAQVGDGAIVTSEPGTSEWSWLFWPQRGEYANTTTFITDVGAMDALEVVVVPHPQREVALFTDGIQHLVLDYAKQTVHSRFFEQMMNPVRASSAEGADDALSRELGSYLSSPIVAGRADDDLTLVLATQLHQGDPRAGAA